jgi:hypothetical protein
MVVVWFPVVHFTRFDFFTACVSSRLFPLVATFRPLFISGSRGSLSAHIAAVRGLLVLREALRVAVSGDPGRGVAADILPAVEPGFQPVSARSIQRSVLNVSPSFPPHIPCFPSHP